ncbi:hypothetical protein GCK32_005379 [Trichostrongylus colubriformis]|uniref:Uncharacterized protein n=1 Tax=Trichostrongylus colubriformis TaxID=6319 RepID=A0AAN8IAJ7_TRICO
MKLMFLVLLLLFAAAHGTDYPFAIRLENGTFVYPFAMQLKDIDLKRNSGETGTTVYPFAIQLKDIDIKGIRGESGASKEKSETKNVFEKVAGEVKRLKEKWNDRKNTRKQKD